MECPECHRDNPDVASFCHRCGHSFRAGSTGKHGRGHSYVVQSAESVAQFALISTIMPQSNREVADNFRWAITIGTVLILGLTLFGILPGAILAAALLVPLAYLVYIYDVNLWEDAPAPVVLSLFVFTGILGALVSMVFFRWIFEGDYLQLIVAGGRAGVGSIPFVPLLIFAVLLPIIAEVVKNLGPTYLASRPAYDDLIDGLTFGVAAGTAYAAAETLVAFWPVIASGQLRTTDGIFSWLVIVLNLMVVKSLIYGTATGLAAAAFSGRGEAYDGFTPRYFATFALAAGVNILYWVGQRLFVYVPFGQGLGLLWGLLILGVLILRIRVMMQAALIDAAIEDAVNDHPKAATSGSGYCPECESQLLPDSLFCVVCGSSVRAASSTARREIRSPSGGVA